MKVAGAVVRGVSMMYATTVGKELEIASVMIAPDADQVNISIWPGVSRMMWLDRGCISLILGKDGGSTQHTPPFQPFSRLDPALDRTWL
jgi:hypothetical protein